MFALVRGEPAARGEGVAVGREDRRGRGRRGPSRSRPRRASRAEVRAAAERLIEGGGVRVDGERAPRRSASRPASGSRSTTTPRAHPPAPSPAPPPRGRAHGRLRGRARRGQARRHRHAPRTRARDAASSTALPPAGSGGDDPEAPASCTGSTATPRDCSCSPAIAGPARSGRAARPQDRARVPRARARPPAGAHRHDRRADRARPSGRAHGGRRPLDKRTPSRTSSCRRRSHARRCSSCRLETGRTHQIRVHLAAIGHPVVGDPTTAGRRASSVKRQFLHAARLAFAHPSTGDPLEFEIQAAPPTSRPPSSARRAAAR